VGRRTMMADTDNPFGPDAGAGDAGSEEEVDAEAGAGVPAWATLDVDDPDTEEKAGLLGAEEGGGGGKGGGGDGGAAAPATVPACACLSVAFYRPYFDVDQGQVLARALRALWPPAASGFLSSLGGKPDLYGPFWAATTLIFVITALSNFTSWLTFKDATEAQWIYDMSLLSIACSFVYGFWAGGGAVVWAAARSLGAGAPTLVQALCVYGYSLVVFIPVALLCSTTLEVLDWLATLLGLAISLSFVLLNLWPAWAASAMPTSARNGLLGVVALAHVVFALALKLYFFQKGGE